MTSIKYKDSLGYTLLDELDQNYYTRRWQQKIPAEVIHTSVMGLESGILFMRNIYTAGDTPR